MGTQRRSILVSTANTVTDDIRSHFENLLLRDYYLDYRNGSLQVTVVSQRGWRCLVSTNNQRPSESGNIGRVIIGRLYVVYN